MSCPCDTHPHPAPLDIGAGLTVIPRQVAGFTEFRRAMLADIRQFPALADWHARKDDDLGVMLLELWAYACDVVAFYDMTIAHELYLRTAREPASLRRLIARLGYVPRPATAASVWLALSASGPRPLKLAAGTAFRSAAFDDEAPQVFELDAATVLHPETNGFAVAPVRAGTLGSGSSPIALASLVVERPGNRLRRGDAVLLRAAAPVSRTEHARVTALSSVPGEDNQDLLRLTLSPSVQFRADTPLAALEVTAATQRAGLWTQPGYSGDPSAISANGLTLVLDGLHRRIRPGDALLVQRGSTLRRVAVASVADQPMTVSPAGLIETTNSDGEAVTVLAPAAKAPATRLTLSATLNPGGATAWTAGNAAEITVHYGFAAAATPAAVAQEVFSPVPGGNLPLHRRRGRTLEQPRDGSTPSRVILEDRRGQAVLADASVDFAEGRLLLGAELADHTAAGTLSTPVRAHGNVVRASRGETVLDEILGSGDATLPSQSFKLKKGPLTYRPASHSGDARGVASTLEVRVDGILWQEVPSFYGRSHDERVFIVRQNDEGDSIVTFGDGRRGPRLPTGRDNVVASYRHGAGSASPPPGAITQPASPVDGLAGVAQPLAAFGGSDAEGPDTLRSAAPRSALLLGRAVSLLDFQAAAAAQPGVRAVRAAWRWHPLRQRPMVQIWYIGDAGLEADIGASLRQLSDPGTGLAVDRATPVPLRIALQLDTDPVHVATRVADRVRAALTNPASGILAPERIGIEVPLYRSPLVGQALAVPGTVAIPDLQADGAPFTGLALPPVAGGYYDVQAGGLVINGAEVPHG